MKKIIILILALGLIGFLAWYTFGLMKNEGKSDKELIEYSIEDTLTVDKIIITDAFSNSIEVIRNGKTIRVIDLYEFLSRGSHASDITLQDNDIIFIPYYDLILAGNDALELTIALVIG